MTSTIDHESVKRYPLEWPVGWKRTPSNHRVSSTFKTKGSGALRAVSVEVATLRLETELDRLHATAATLSYNLSLNLRGIPRGDERPLDPGVAVYFAFHGKATVLACDHYTTVAGNIAGIAAHIDALRRVERYGVGTIEQALAGYKALPADSAANWRAVFGFPAESTPSVEQIDRAYKTAARVRHPDVVGGSHEDMAHINRARDYAMLECEGR